MYQYDLFSELYWYTLLPFAVLCLLSFIKINRDLLYFLWLFQVKEYRFDRIYSHIKENLKDIERNLLKEIVILCLISLIMWTLFPAILFDVLFSYFGISSIRTIKEIKKRSLKRPKNTPKVFLIYLIVLTLYATLIVLGSYTNPLLGIAILSLILPIIITLAIAIVTPFSNWQKKKVIKAATEKRRSLKHVRTIGITGSYGKTSTKEFLYAILSQKYKVVKTEGNNNTAMGVANTVLNKVSDDFDFFICEMGAYKIGEIKEICEIAKPEIGIITGINEQHIDLFGSIENTKKAKFELAQNLPETGFAVINQKAFAMLPDIRFVAETIPFSKELINNLNVFPDYITFQYKDTAFRLNALGGHYSENLLAAIITAEKIGMSLAEINEAVLKIELREKYLMQKIKAPQNAIFIDDSYSANPDGVMAALDYLDNAYKEYKKIFVFPGIIELGKKSGEIHQKIWNKIEEVCDIAYIIQKEDKGIAKEHPDCQFIFEKSFDTIAQKLSKDLDEKTVVLFESRGAGVVMKKILNKK